MRIKNLIKIAILCVVSLFACEWSYGANDNILNDLPRSLANGEVKALDVIGISSGTLTSRDVDADQLELNFFYKVEIRNAGVDLYRKSLTEVLSNMKLEKSIGVSDLRWEIIFYDGNMRRICTLYMNRFGNMGYVGKQRVAFSSPFMKTTLISWLKENFPLK